MTQTAPDSVGRRELNKVRTRDAIVAALREQVALRPVDQVTVDRVAEAAGISRRTFFNYFPSIPAVVSDVIGAHTEHLADAIGELSASGSPLDQVRALLATHGLPRELLEWLALLNLHSRGSRSEGLLALERAIWAERGGWLEGQLRRRLPAGVDDLFVASLAATIMSCFAAAEQAWIQTLSPDHAVDDPAATSFLGELDRALAYAAAGWAPSHLHDHPSA